MTNGPAAIEASGVTKVFSTEGGPLIALQDLTFSVDQMEFVSLLGPSGCGKSTLLRLIHGLEPLTAGKLLVQGQPHPRPGRSRGFVFQQDSLLPWRTIIDNVALGPELHGGRQRLDRDRIRELLEMVGLGGFEDFYPHELSGGMRQRANLARALAVQPTMLLMDEPFGALDAQTREDMQAELLRLWEHEQKTVLFVTHSIEEAAYLSDRVLVMSARPGRISADVPIDLPRPRSVELLRSDRFTAVARDLWDLLRSASRKDEGGTSPTRQGTSRTG